MQTTLTYTTARDIANELDRSIYQVRYAIDRLGIEPIHRAGLVRLFDPSATDAVRGALAEINSRRTAVA